AFFGERFRPRVAKSGIGRSNTRANVARDGRGFGGTDSKPAAGAHIGRPSLERLFDTRPDLIFGEEAASPGAANVDWYLPNCGADCERSSAESSQARVTVQAGVRGVAAGIPQRGSSRRVLVC